MDVNLVNANLDDFFKHENHAYPPSLSDYGKIRKASAKSDFLKCLNKINASPPVEIMYNQPCADSALIDGAVMVQMSNPRSSSTFGEYTRNEIGRQVCSRLRRVNQLDIVFDVYRKDSKKKKHLMDGERMVV